jgi:hypothetical protein
MLRIASECEIPQELTYAALEALLARERQAASPAAAILRAASLEEAFAQLDWELQEDGEANVVGIRYAGATFSASWPSLGRWSSYFESTAPYVRPSSFIRMHVEDMLGLTQGGGYLEKRITRDGKEAQFSREPRTEMAEGWDQLA